MELLDHPFIFGSIIGSALILIIATVAWYGHWKRYEHLPSVEGFNLRYFQEAGFKKLEVLPLGGDRKY